MGKRWISTVVAALVLTAAHRAEAGSLTLGSGRTVEILAVGPLQSTHGWSCLMMKYQTQVPLTDMATLRKEVDELWQRFVIDAERSKYECAVISANEPPTGVIITHNQGYNFVFEKKSGSWHTRETKERAEAKLDPDFMREFMDRLDSTYEHQEMNAALLYMADDWTLTIDSLDQNLPSSQTLNRLQVVQIANATFAHMTAHQHHREITKITISNEGRSARVESRESETMTVNGREVSTSGPSVDSFELRDDMVLWTKSATLIEKRTETQSD